MSAVLSSREELAPQPPVGTAPFDDLFRDLIQMAERGRQLSLVVQLREFQGQLSEMARRYHSGDAEAVDGFLAEWQVEQQLRDSIERRPAPEACGGVAGLVDACRRDLNDLVRDEATKKQRFERRIALLAHLAQLETLAGAGVAGAVPFLSDGTQVVHADEVATRPFHSLISHCDVLPITLAALEPLSAVTTDAAMREELAALCADDPLAQPLARLVSSEPRDVYGWRMSP